MKRLYIVMTALAMTATACSVKDVEQYRNSPAIYFMHNTIPGDYVQRDSIARNEFFYDRELIRDTVWVMVCAMGDVENYDRPIGLRQSNAGKAAAAVAGTHYQPFDTPSLADMMVIKAGEARSLVPIVMLRDESLETTEVRLEIEVVQNEHFRPGIDNWRDILLKSTAKATKPLIWDTVWYGYFGPTWGPEKFYFIINATGYTGNDQWERSPDDLGFAAWMQSTVLQSFAEYNLAHPNDPLKEADGTLVRFD